MGKNERIRRTVIVPDACPKASIARVLPSMNNIAIVEDQPDQAEFIAESVARFPGCVDVSVECFSTADELADYLEEGNIVDICFMDIDLGEGGEFEDGIDAVRKLFPEGCSTQVIYVTGHMRYCTPVYETDHIYLISKPIQMADFDAALSKALRNLETRKSKPLAIISKGKVVALPPSRVAYVESERRKAILHTGDEVIETYAKLSDLAHDLPDAFIQCHKSYLVNLAFVQELSARSLRLTIGGTLPVSRQRSSAVREAYLDYLRSRL